MAEAEAGAAREQAERRVAGVLGSAQDRAGRVEPGARSKALADAFEVPGPGSPRMFQDVIDEYVEARWQDRLGLTRGFEHVRDVAGEGEWGEQVACVRRLYRETDRAITGDKAFEAGVREEVEALCRKAGATEFDMALVRIDRVPGVVDVLHRHPDGSAYALPRFPPLPPGRGSFEAETWDSHLATLSADWARSRRGEAGPRGGAEADRAVRDGYLALRGAAFFTGGSHYSAERDRPPPVGAARPVEPGADRAEGSSVSAGVEAGPGASAAGAADRSAGRASGDDGAGRGGDAPGRDESSRRGGDDDDSLAKRLAGSGDHADQAVCKYIVDCFDGAVQKVVASFDRKLSGLAGGKDPAAVARAVEKELEAGRVALRREVISARDQVVDDVRATLGPKYRLGPDSSSVHAPVPGVESAGSAVDRARVAFRRDVDSARRETVRAVHGALGGQPRFAPGRQGVVPPAGDEAPAAAYPAAAAARDARAEFVGSPRAVAVGHVTEVSLMVAAARGSQSLVRMGDLIETSPLRQAGLETVGCDPVLVKLCADVRDSAREPSRASALRTLAADLGDRHLARCREEPEAAQRDEAAFARGRAALRSGACAARASEVERGFAPACRVEIDARVGRVPSAVPADRDLAGQTLSLEGRAWLGRMRGRSVVPEASGPDRAVVAGAPRGAVRSFLGRRAQGFERVVQLAGTRRGRVAAAVSSRLLRWGTSGGARRLKAVGLVLGSSKHLMAGLVRAGADPVAVAAASSPGAARAIATGASRSLADGARAADHRRLVQVAEELDRRQTGTELTSGGAGSARTARLEHWADYRGRRGAAAEMLRALHADRHQAITERVSREKDRALEARTSGDRDFDLLRERVRGGGVRVWAEAWRGRGIESFDGRDWRFDGRRTHPDGVPAPGSAADGVKAMLAISGGRVRHGASARLKVGRDLAVEVPQGLGDEQRQSALIYGAAKTIVVARNPTLAPGSRETVVLSGMLASAMAQRLDATYEPPGEARKVDSARVGDDVLRRGNALVQEVGARVSRRMEDAPGNDVPGREKELDRQVDFVVSRSFAERPRRGPAAEGRDAARSVGDAAGRAVEVVRGRG